MKKFNTQESQSSNNSSSKDNTKSNFNNNSKQIYKEVPKINKQREAISQSILKKSYLRKPSLKQIIQTSLKDALEEMRSPGNYDGGRGNQGIVLKIPIK